MTKLVADRCPLHPEKQQSIHCIPCQKTCCYECIKEHHRGQDHSIETVEAAHEQSLSDFERAARDMEEIRNLLPNHVEGVDKAEELKREGLKRIDEIAHEMKERLESVTNNLIATSACLELYNRNSQDLSTIQPAARDPMLNRLVAQKPKLEQLLHSIDSNRHECQKIEKYLPNSLPRLDEIFEPWSPNWLIDEELVIPGADAPHLDFQSREIGTQRRPFELPFSIVVALKRAPRDNRFRITFKSPFNAPISLYNLELVVGNIAEVPTAIALASEPVANPNSSVTSTSTGPPPCQRLSSMIVRRLHHLKTPTEVQPISFQPHTNAGADGQATWSLDSVVADTFFRLGGVDAQGNLRLRLKLRFYDARTPSSGVAVGAEAIRFGEGPILTTFGNSSGNGAVESMKTDL